MAKFKVCITVSDTYVLEVEAYSEEQAQDIASGIIADNQVRTINGNSPIAGSMEHNWTEETVGT